MLEGQVNSELLLLRRRRRRRRRRRGGGGGGGEIIISNKLFITKQKNNNKIFALPSCESIESQQVKQKPVKQKPRNHKKQHPCQARIWKLIASSIVIAMLFYSTQKHQIVDAAESSILPTVIVRGFLNYRTTVDGTVLLFTPDAGSSSSSVPSITATRSSSSHQSLADSSSSSFPLHQQQRQHQPTRASELNEQLLQTEPPTLSTFSSSLDSPPSFEEWRPITATPPLRPMQSSFRPARVNSQTTSTNVAVDRTQVVAISDELLQTGRPSVQADEVTESVIDAGVREFSELSVTPSPVHELPSQKRPRRPSLGFTGQSGRPPARFQHQSSSPAQQPPATHSQQSFPLKPAGGGLSIRRAGLSGTSSDSSTTSNPLQGRLTNAQARLRNKLKRPTTPSPVAASSSTSNSLASLKSDPHVAELIVNPQPQPHTLSSLSSSTNSPAVGSDEVLGAAGRPGAGESTPSSAGEGGLLSGNLMSSSGSSGPELQGGQLGSLPLGLDSFFSPPGEGGEPSEPQVTHQQPRELRTSKKENNERLSGFLDQQQSAKFVARTRPDSEQQHGKLSHQLAANLAGLAPSFAAPLNSGSRYSAPTTPTPSDDLLLAGNLQANSSETNQTVSSPGAQLKLQTITRTYSTLLTSSKTRLVPLQVGSSTGVHTITEEFVMTKLLTAYQTMPAGEFILPEQTRTPFEMFKELPNSIDNVESERPIQAPSAPSSPQIIAPDSTPANQQEQAISLAPSNSRSPTDWLHDFSSPQTNPMEQQDGNQQLAALLEQQAQEANLAALSGHPFEPLDGLASSLDPAALLADGNIPDLNNPLVLAAAIQNPQLAAVILAAQQLRLKQRGALHKHQPLNNLQPSYSTTVSTQIRPTTYTVRDTMYTTRLVSFRDGRTVRTRTVSEPGSVIEQVLTSTATELTPVTITIQPTGVHHAHQATAMPLGASSGSTQATLQNALIATQLAQLLARRQQQLQPSFMAAGQRANQLAALQQLFGGNMNGGQAQQLAANNQLLAMKMQQQVASSSNPQQMVSAKQQFQPNLQQLLASMGAAQQSATSDATASRKSNEAPPTQAAPTPPLPAGPTVSTLTSLQVRTYTVHNAFKTIYRTITSTQLIVSTLAAEAGKLSASSVVARVSPDTSDELPRATLGGASPWSLPNRPSLFSIIRFPNDECFDSSNQSGTCYTAFECRLLGGQPSSPCAAGFGACCIVSRTCHVSTRERVVYFKNPSYPSADSDEKFCDLTVELVEPSVCQLRLDFLDFQLDPPTEGACANDYMELSASGVPPQTVPRLCGLNRNQHLYISVPQGTHAERSVSIVFYTDPVGDHRWQIKVTQVDCAQRVGEWKHSLAQKWSASPLWAPHPNLRLQSNGPAGGRYSTTLASGFQTLGQAASALANELLRPQFTPRAPIGCLQFFTQPSGIIESFNFGHYLNNLDYSICLQRAPDTCRVVFTSSDYDWSLNGVGVSGAASGVGDQDCARDYLLIPGASRTGDGFTYDRYCGARLHYFRGQSLSAPLVTKSAGPLVLRFHSDAHHESLNNGGFRLQYEQSAQDCTYHTPEESGALAPQQLLASTLSDSQPAQQVPVEPIYLSSRLSNQVESSAPVDTPTSLVINKNPQRRADNAEDEQPNEQLTRRLAQAFQLITSRI